MSTKQLLRTIFHRLGLLIYQHSQHLDMPDGEVEADESYFGGTRKGKRGLGASGKTMAKFIPLLYPINTVS